MASAPVAEFITAATEGRCERARRLLRAQPAIAEDPWARLVLGRGWDGDPNAPGGPLGRAPLLYVTHSCFASTALARELLARGADPNATFRNEYGDMSAVYGAAGVVHDPALTRVLLEAGADPDDGESLYHAAYAADPACLRILLEHGATVAGTAALPAAIDGDHVEHVRLLLAHGADPNEGHWALLVHAVRRGCGPALIGLLAEHGAELDRRGGEWSTPPEHFRTAYQNAVLRGRDDVAALLAVRGADTTVVPEDRAVAALARGERPGAPLPATLANDAQEVLAQAALDGHVDVVVGALGVDRLLHNGGGPPGTLLHMAGWAGDPTTATRLLELGADPLARSGAEFDTPLAWTFLGSQHHGLPGRDHVAVAELLLARGAVLEPGFARVATGPLADWLEERTSPAR
jgi:ankyrin repeat protein